VREGSVEGIEGVRKGWGEQEESEGVKGMRGEDQSLDVELVVIVGKTRGRQDDCG
jgi:hypothetical protein